MMINISLLIVYSFFMVIEYKRNSPAWSQAFLMCSILLTNLMLYCNAISYLHVGLLSIALLLVLKDMIMNNQGKIYKLQCFVYIFGGGMFEYAILTQKALTIAII